MFARCFLCNLETAPRFFYVRNALFRRSIVILYKNSAGFSALNPNPGFCHICVSAIITGIVSTEAKLTKLTVFAAMPVSLSYFAANITVLLALGALA